MTRSTNSEHVAHLQRMANESWRGSPEHAALTAAIAALSAPKPEGEWVLVPREPTEAMLVAMHSSIRILCDPAERTADIQNDREVWAAMLTDSPPAPVSVTLYGLMALDGLESSAPVGVEGLLADLETIWHSVSDDKETNAAYERLKIALAQQPATVDGAMVERALSARAGSWSVRQLFADEDEAPDIMRIALTAALAAQQGGES